jgi:hypothetical protein
VLTKSTRQPMTGLYIKVSGRRPSLNLDGGHLLVVKNEGILCLHILVSSHM